MASASPFVGNVSQMLTLHYHMHTYYILQILKAQATFSDYTELHIFNLPWNRKIVGRKL